MARFHHVFQRVLLEKGLISFRGEGREGQVYGKCRNSIPSTEAEAGEPQRADRGSLSPGLAPAQASVAPKALPVPTPGSCSHSADHRAGQCFPRGISASPGGSSENPGCGPGICTANRIPGDTDAAGPGTSLGERLGETSDA